MKKLTTANKIILLTANKCEGTLMNANKLYNKKVAN